MEYSLIFNFIQGPFVLLTIILCSLAIKLYFSKLLIINSFRASTVQKPYIFLIGTLIGASFGDIAWIMKISHQLFFAHTSYAPVAFFIRIAWAFLILQYQSLSLFMQSLIDKNLNINRIQKLFLFISSCVSLYFFCLAFFGKSLLTEAEREIAHYASNLPLEMFVMRCVVIYLFYTFIIPCIYYTFKHIRTTQLPKILKKQIKFFLTYMLCPYLIMESIQLCYFTTYQGMEYYFYGVTSISTIIFSYAMYYCLKKVLGLRFLNKTYPIEEESPSDNFKVTLNQLNNSTNIAELSHIVGTFFKNNFNISPIKIHLQTISLSLRKSEPKSIVEQFIYTHRTIFEEWVNKFKILVYDDIVFSNFYEESNTHIMFANFLQSLNADILVPLFAERKMVAYLIIERDALGSECYTQEICDKIIVFANHLGTIVHTIQNKDREQYMQKEQEYKENLYKKEQLLMLYQESIRFFLCHPKQKSIGIIYYKNGRFSFGNQAASAMINTNLNFFEGHELTKACTHIAECAQQYRSAQTITSYDDHGNQIIFTAVPHLEQNSVIITATYPDISDIIHPQINYLTDLTKRDYLLYLHTTQHGQFINEYIPDSCEKFLNFKINVLSIALSIKITLLDIPDEDNKSLVDLLHHISGRKTLHTIDIKNTAMSENIGMELFNYSSHNMPLLEKLNGSTLYINNIHLLTREIQEYIVDYIRLGQLRIFGTEYRIPTDVRIICSASYDLYKLVQDDVFSPSLYEELQKNTIYLPLINTLDPAELGHLIDGFTMQAIKTQDFKNMFMFSEKEKLQIIEKNPLSILELKTKIQQLLAQKSKKNNLDKEVKFDPAYLTTDPELAQAARLGKQALKDPQIMLMLWNKFKNQSRIADFLGVSRSAVCKRLKEIM